MKRFSIRIQLKGGGPGAFIELTLQYDGASLTDPERTFIKQLLYALTEYDADLLVELLGQPMAPVWPVAGEI